MFITARTERRIYTRAFGFQIKTLRLTTEIIKLNEPCAARNTREKCICLYTRYYVRVVFLLYGETVILYNRNTIVVIIIYRSDDNSMQRYDKDEKLL